MRVQRHNFLLTTSSKQLKTSLRSEEPRDCCSILIVKSLLAIMLNTSKGKGKNEVEPWTELKQIFHLLEESSFLVRVAFSQAQQEKGVWGKEGRESLALEEKQD